MASLSSDLFYGILRRLDGATLASATCACAAFSSNSKEERLWDSVCSSIPCGPQQAGIMSKVLITSIGGFKKFYADCFPLIVNKEVPEFRFNDYLQYSQELIEAEYYGDVDELEIFSPSDFVFIVDIRTKQSAQKFSGAYQMLTVLTVGFTIVLSGLICSPTLTRDDDHAEVALSVSDGLPPITSMAKRKEKWEALARSP